VATPEAVRHRPLPTSRSLFLMDTQFPGSVGLPLAAALLALSGTALAGDWPMFRGDAARSGYVQEELPAELHLAWVHRGANRPAPAWPQLSRMTFDRAHQPVIAGGLVFFGDTVDGAVRALELASGEQRWCFFTEGPVRFAPVAFEGRLFVGSDDGFLYCLNAADGSLRWRRRGGGDERLVLGNGHLISRWPVRGGPVVRDGVLYFAAGIWPSEGIYVHALDARTGEPLWVNDDSGTIYMAQPHGGAEAESGIGAQGHLVATEEHLLVPNGRAVPAAFRRSDGVFEYFHLQRSSPGGGTATMASGKYFFNSGTFFEAKTGAAGGKVGATAIAGLPDGIATATKTGITVWRWGADDPANGTRGLEKEREIPGGLGTGALIAIGTKLVAGGEGRVTLVELETGERCWSGEVRGTAHALAVSDGRLVVGTDEGVFYCYDGVEREGSPPVIDGAPERVAAPERAPERARFIAAAGTIASATGVRAGYCLDLGAGEGELARALALTTELQIIALEPDPARAATARRRLAGEGLLGTRVSVLEGSLDDLRRFPSYLADLIVSARLLEGGDAELAPRELERLRKPGGGMSCLGSAEELRVRVREGALPDTGEWTHLYADPGNTACSGDPLRGPLGMLWFREIAQDLPQRHGRGPAPLFRDGRLFSLGLDSLVAVDAYNGRLLWEHPFPGILRAFDGDHLMGISGTGGMYCVAEEGVFVREGPFCHRLDPTSGEELGVFEAPDEKAPGVWGYLACAGGMLYGSLANPEHVVTYRYLRGGDLTGQLTESNVLFALDAETGELRWTHRAEHSVRHNAIAIGGDRLFLIDRPLAEVDRVREEELAPEDRPPHPPGTLVCLDARTGREQWRVEDDVFGTLLALQTEHDALLMAYQPTRFRLLSEVGGRMAVFDARTGKRRWAQDVRYASRPMLVDETIYAEGGAWDLLSGEAQPFEFNRSYGCGILAAGANLLVFRSATLGYCELDGERGTENYGGIRPGCWINALPVGGLVLLPDASTGCVCSYLNRSWIALEPTGLRPPTALPDGGAFPGPVRIELRPPRKGAKVRYTLDGTTPTESSPLYAGRLTLRESGKLKMRSFSDDAFPSRVASASFVIDPLLLSLEEQHWRAWDRGAPVNGAPSDWSVSGGTVVQRSNIFSSVAEKPHFSEQAGYGTLFIHEGGERFADGELRLQIRSADNDGIGVAFRLQDEQRHYLLHWNQERRFRVLAVRDGDEYRVLARDEVPYTSGRWYDLSVRMHGARIEIWVDGVKVLEAEDDTWRRGTVALFSWGSTGVEFRGIAFE